MNEVERFITEFQTAEGKELFGGKCNYWFSVILYRRFIRSGAKIMFNMESERFATMINKKLYDISGDITNVSKWIPWLDFQDSEVKTKIINKFIMF